MKERLCEIAFITGQIIGKDLSPFDDLEEAYNFFARVLDDWYNQRDIQNDNEGGYITEYANRVIRERLAKLM